MPSNPLHADFAALVGQVFRLWRRCVDDRLQPFGLTEATWLPLFYLSQAPAAMRQKELAACLQLDSSSVVRILDALQAAGLIERREEAGDRRAKAITLTAAGRDLATRIESVVRQVRAEVLGEVPDTELAAANSVLGSVYRRLSALKGGTEP